MAQDFAEAIKPLVDRARHLIVTGDRDGAIANLKLATVLQPSSVAALHLLAEAGRIAERPEEASVAFRRVLRVDPLNQNAYCGLAVMLLRLHHDRPAQILAEVAIAIDPAFTQAWAWIGQIDKELRQDIAARRAAKRAVALEPDNLTALQALGRLSTDDDKARVDRAMAMEGIHALQRAATLQPGYPVTYDNLANAAIRLGLYDHALLFVRRLLVIQRFEPAAFSLLSVISTMRGEFEWTVKFGQMAAVTAPNRSSIWINLGLGYQSLRRMREARRCYERALRINPHSQIARLNLSIILLFLGQYREGWVLYEARWQTDWQTLPNRAPLWDGSDPTGQRILIESEQGQGDTLQFIRYAAMLKARGAETVVLAQGSLRRLIERSPGVDKVVSRPEAIGPVDAMVAMMSLPRFFKTTIETIPAPIPYLFAAPEDKARWADRITALPGLKIGLVWAGDAHQRQLHAHAANQRRSVKLAELEPLARIPGISWVSLQKGAPAVEAKAPPAGMVLHDWMAEVHDFADTAAIAVQLDLVITVDTSVAHLAGGVGVPVWVLSRYDGCWRWLLDRDDTPWYPNMRLFRQERPGDWQPVIAHMAQALAGRVDAIRSDAA